MATQRAHWGSRLGFVLAAAGSAVGLGNIWRFPGEVENHGGGLFVLTYVICIAVIGLPVLMAEVFLGRTAQNSPVGAFRHHTKPASPWMGIGWLGVAAAFVILSFYSVVAGWCMHYAWISVTTTFQGMSPDEIQTTFVTLSSDPTSSTMWHLIFMGLTVSIVVAGIREGIELWVKILMPVLFLLLLILLGYAIVEGEFAKGMAYMFTPDPETFTWRTILAAIGQGFFTLSVGMGALITYGSYLRKDDDLPSTTLSVGGIDTVIAILAGMVIFPILILAALEGQQEGAAVVFIALPNAFADMPGGMLLAPTFFILLTFAALTSSISLLEVATAYFIDERGWSRTKAALGTGGLIAILGIPSAVAGGSVLFGESMRETFGVSWFDLMNEVGSTWMLTIGGLGIALFVGWRIPSDVREAGFMAGSSFQWLYPGWVFLLRFIIPIGLAGVIIMNAYELIATQEEESEEETPAVEVIEEEASSDTTNRPY